MLKIHVFLNTSFRDQPINCLNDPIKPRYSFLNLILAMILEKY